MHVRTRPGVTAEDCPIALAGSLGLGRTPAGRPGKIPLLIDLPLPTPLSGSGGNYCGDVRSQQRPFSRRWTVSEASTVAWGVERRPSEKRDCGKRWRKWSRRKRQGVCPSRRRALGGERPAETRGRTAGRTAPGGASAESARAAGGRRRAAVLAGGLGRISSPSVLGNVTPSRRPQEEMFRQEARGL